MNPYRQRQIAFACMQYQALREARNNVSDCRKGLIEALKAASESGATQTEIAEGLGVSRQRISQLLREHDG